MSIGRKDTLYTLVDETTGTSHSFKYGKMHITGGVIYIDEYGDDVAQWFYDNYINDVPQTRSRAFKFNGLVGLKFEISATLNNDGVTAEWGAYLYIEGHKTDTNGNYVKYLNGNFDGKKNSFVSPNPTQGKMGLMFCYMDNATYQGISIYPAHFVHRYDGGYFYKVPYGNIGNAPYYQPTSNTVAAQIDAGQYIGSIWGSPYDRVPANYIMRDYHTLGFSDSGDITKQQATIVQGFPYGSDDDGESTSKGGQGLMDDTSEPIAIDDARTLFVGNLFRLYKLSVTQLSALSNFLLDPSFLANVSKLFNDPMDYLTSLVAIPYSGFSGYDEALSIGSVTSTVTGNRITNFFKDLDCGSIDFNEYFQTFMDYSPYTRVTLYLPMIGYVPVNVDEFQNDRISIKYRLDALTGQCVAFVSNSRGLVATYNGNCAYHIPLRSRDYSNMISGIINTAATSAHAGMESMIYNTALNGAMNFKPAGSVTTAGTFSGNCGVLTNKKPYLIIERPYISIPNRYGHNIGYMSKITAKLSSLHGFTKVEAIHLDNVIATREEKAELEALLRNGVVLP